ncbi:MAG: adenylate/guanylate cyclase domain-containing protein [Acidimicrobiia bacterium]
MSQLPTGTVTFLFTDIEGSTRLLQAQGDEYQNLLEKHGELIRAPIAAEGGIEISTEGDSFFVVFTSAPDAVRAAAQAQQALAGHPWPLAGEVRVRMGLHTGIGSLGGDSYVGIDVHRAARIAAAAHGEQIVLSEATAHLVEHSLIDGAALRELGVYHLKDLAQPERIFQLIIPELRADFPPLSTLDAVPNNLPTKLSSFIGRDRELAQAIELLAATRLLTLTGPGGTGKTRLALQVGAEVSDDFADGVFFVRLDQVDEEDQVPASILEALDIPGVPTGVDPREYLAGYATGKELLLILDNMEQLMESGPLVGELLAASDKSKALVTSRAPLRIAGEQEMSVPPMDTADPTEALDTESLLQCEAVALFAERARSVRPNFAITSENGQAVAAITNSLDGLPLAIELVASRVKLLPPDGLLERLDKVLDTAAGRDSPARQRTLRSTVAWSYELLDQQARRLFERLSVFRGGAALDEIETVCGPSSELGIDVLDGLETLVDQSLVVQFELEGEPRFRMFSTIRHYATEQLDQRGEADDLKRRHAAAYLSLAERAGPRLTRKDRLQWLDRLSKEYHNLDAALNWALGAQETEIALRLVAALWRFWTMRGHLLAVEAIVDSALSLPGDFPKERARALEAKGGMTYWLGDVAGTAPYYQEALDIWRDVGDQSEIANALYNFSFPSSQLDGVDAEESLLEEALAIYEELDDRSGIAGMRAALGNVAAKKGDPETWMERSREAIAYFDQEEHPFEYGWLMSGVAWASFMQGNVPDALQYLREGLRLFASVDDVSALVTFMAFFSGVARGVEDEDGYHQFAGILSQLVAQTGWQAQYWDPTLRAFVDWDEIEQLESSPPERFEEGRKMSVEEAVAFALEWEPAGIE